VLGGVLGGVFAKEYKSQPLVAPDPSSAPVLGLAVAPTPTPAANIGTPEKLIIKKIGVNASVEAVGLDKLNRMDVPKKADDVGWYNLGVKPGEVGNAVIDGHLDRIDLSPAVFWNLKNLQNGDQIQVQDADNQTYTFKVMDVESYPWNNFPLQQVFGPTNKKMLNLITCQGTYDTKIGLYTDREVVYSELVQ